MKVLMKDATNNLCARTKHHEIWKNNQNSFNSIVIEYTCKWAQYLSRKNSICTPKFVYVRYTLQSDKENFFHQEQQEETKKPQCRTKLECCSCCYR